MTAQRRSPASTVILLTYAAIFSVPLLVRLLGADALSLFVIVPSVLAAVALFGIAAFATRETKAAFAEFLPWLYP